MTKLDQLRLQIKEANKAYWQDNRQIMSDPAYDRLVEELRQLSPNDPLLDELGKEKPSEDKITHKKPMLSLAKFYKWTEIVNWCSSVARSDDELFMVSPKYDGLSVEFYISYSPVNIGSFPISLRKIYPFWKTISNTTMRSMETIGSLENC